MEAELNRFSMADFSVSLLNPLISIPDDLFQWTTIIFKVETPMQANLNALSGEAHFGRG